MRTHLLTAAAAAVALYGAIGSAARATEGGASLYVPGFHGAMAGFVPPPGFYFETDFYSYSGRISAGARTQIGGAVLANVKAEARAAFLTPTWVTPLEIFGGNLAIGVSLPFGVPRVSAGAVISSARLGRTVGFSERDATFNLGDPIVSAVIGWHSGKFHWSTAASVNIPSGTYRDGELSNMSFNRWIGDLSAALTYLDPELGLDISTTVGFEIGGRNNATDYRSGNGIHADLAITKSLTKEWSIGVLAGHFEQVSGDGGAGATLGAHKGRATAVGGAIGYSFEVAGTAVSTQLKLLREVAVENRPKGTIALFTVAIPLGGQAKTAAPTATVVKR